MTSVENSSPTEEVFNNTSPVSQEGLTPTRSNYVPTQMEKFIEFVDFNSVGDLALGTSSLTTRYWTGQLWYFRANELGDVENVTNPEHCLTGLEMETGVTAGRFVTDQQILVGLDSGALVLVDLTKEVDGDRVTHYLEQQTPVVEHDDIVTGLDLWGGVGQNRNGQQHLAASIGADLRLNIYSPTLAIAQTYRPAHQRQVTGVACCQEINTNLATASMDGTVRVWDTRQPKPASSVYRNINRPPSSVTWVPGSQSLVVGTRSGAVVTLDLRQTGQVSEETSLFDREIRRFSWSQKGDRLAVTADDVIVQVLKKSEDNLLTPDWMSSSSHEDYVRGLSWDQNNCLWSAAWDKTVVRHDIAA